MRKVPEYIFMGLKVQRNNKALVHWNIDFTFDCNVKCKDCNKLLGILPWADKNSYLTVKDIRVAAILLKRNFIEVGKIQVSGGEPLLHPGFWDIIESIKKEWKPSIRFYVYTNGTFNVPKRLHGRFFRIIPIEQKIRTHRPFLVSPTDLEIPFAQSIGKVCKTMSVCGRNFDAYGFSFCSQAPHIGRILGMDAHKPYPILEGDPEICRHCILSVTKRMFHKLIQLARDKEFEYPTKTYREGIKREKDYPMKYKRFLNRLLEYEKIPEG